MWRTLAVAAAAGALLGAALPAPSPASGCLRVAAGTPLQPLLDAAPEGGAVCLEDGVYPGPIVVAKGLRIEGGRGAVLRGSGRGSTVRLEADGAALVGVTVDGSGSRFDKLDAAVRVHGDDVRVERVAIRSALFGILVEQSNRVRVLENDVAGNAAKPLGLRGDAIRLWEVRDSVVAGNRVQSARDIVVWYSPGNRISGNAVANGRYGTHLMYSHDNVLRDNEYRGNVVGIFAMYSRRLTIAGNRLARSRGAAGIGLGAKESGDLTVQGNLFVDDTIGVYLDTSPLYLDEENRFERNLFRFCDTAVVFHSSESRNTFADNSFRDNRAQVRVEGRGDALGVTWRHNDWDDYAGYDLDGDGRGDVPYELRSLVGQLTARHPALAFFRGSPAIALVELVGRVVPLFRAPTLLVDPSPRMAPPAQSDVRAH
jgi:nitrous oxidase accessory protein